MDCNTGADIASITPVLQFSEINLKSQSHGNVTFFVYITVFLWEPDECNIKIQQGDVKMRRRFLSIPVLIILNFTICSFGIAQINAANAIIEGRIDEL